MMDSITGLKKWKVCILSKWNIKAWHFYFAPTKELAIEMIERSISDNWNIAEDIIEVPILAEDIIDYIEKRKKEIELNNVYLKIDGKEPLDTACLAKILKELSPDTKYDRSNFDTEVACKRIY